MIQSSKYPISSSKECIKSGNDLQIAGCKANENDIIEGIEKGEIKIEDYACAIRILRIIYAKNYKFSFLNSIVLLFYLYGYCLFINKIIYK